MLVKSKKLILISIILLITGMPKLYACNCQALDRDNLIEKIFVNSQLEAKLIEPQFVDFPYLGESFNFLLDDSLMLKAKVMDLKPKAIWFRSSYAEHQGCPLHIDLVFKVERPKTDSHDTCNVALASGLGAAVSADIPMSITTYGILPGALVIAGAVGAALQEHEQLKSFDFKHGDFLSLSDIQLGGVSGGRHVLVKEKEKKQ